MRESSFMMVVPRNAEDISDPVVCIEGLSKAEGIEVKNVEHSEDSGTLHITVDIDGNESVVRILPFEFDVPPEMVTTHFFPDIDVEAIQNTEICLAVDMDCTGDIQEFYHNQLRVITAMVPDMLAIFDCPAEKIISGKWAALAASSRTLPAPRYIYTVQAISGEGDEVWLHTHGLGRCGLSEIEILCSSRDMYDSHYRIIETVANRMIENNEQMDMYDPFFVAWLTEEVALVVTLVPWEEALESYPGITLGSKLDREDPCHAEDNACIMLYRTPDDADNKKVSYITDLDAELDANPLYMLTTKETKRMSQLARERVQYLKKGFLQDKNKALVKIGLEIDEEFFNPDNPDMKEHIWFELLEFNGDTMKLQLTQDTYYVKALKKDDICEYTVDDITDWIVFGQERRITPDDVYIMEL